MDIDWEVEIGGGAPVIEAHWPGFIDLRANPERITEIEEASAFPPLADLLLRLNSPNSPVWTSKCDIWNPEQAGLAIYIDLLPYNGIVFADWRRAEGLCRALVEQINGKGAHDESGDGATITLVVRQAVAGQAEGCGITVYFSAEGAPAESRIADAMVAFSNAIQSALK
jgi:hypothetical protein